MASTETVSIRLGADDLATVDELRGEGVSRSAFVRQLLRTASPAADEPTYAESLRLLAESARAGKVQAQVALERALRDQDHVPEGELARILRGA